MIFVTVGTHGQGFDRLVQVVDELAESMDEAVVIQYGNSRFIPVHADGFRWASIQEMEQMTRRARIVVSHAAAGSIILAFSLGKRIVVVPRLRKYHECIDDHQNQLASALTRAGRAVALYDVTVRDLDAAINEASRQPVPQSDTGQLVTSLRAQILQWSAGS